VIQAPECCDTTKELAAEWAGLVTRYRGIGRHRMGEGLSLPWP
jgi:hypothetical protein